MPRAGNGTGQNIREFQRIVKHALQLLDRRSGGGERREGVLGLADDSLNPPRLARVTGKGEAVPGAIIE
jgi:hypothetical protein